MTSTEHSTTRPICVWVVRHGQRADESHEAQDFLEQCDAQGIWQDDPPLTALGIEQARACGVRIREAFHELGILADSAASGPVAPQFLLFASPLQRALKTAETIGDALRVPSIEVLPGLSACAAAVQYYGLQTAYPKMAFARGSYESTGSVVLQSDACAHQLLDSFDNALIRTIRSAAGGKQEHVVVVAHREAIYDMMDAIAPEAARQMRSIPYCAVCAFWLEGQDLKGVLAHVPTDGTIDVSAVLETRPAKLPSQPSS